MNQLKRLIPALALALLSVQAPAQPGPIAETAYVFRTLDTRAPDGPTEQDWAMSELVSAYWVGFAKTGDPNGAGRPVWPLHTRDSDILLDFGRDGVKPVIGLEQRRMQFMENRYDSGRM